MMYPIDARTVKKLWPQSAVSCQGHLGLWGYRTHPDRYRVRLEVIKLYYRGWDAVSRRHPSAGTRSAPGRRRPSGAPLGIPASAARSTAGCGAARLLLGLDMRHRLG
jgi:hypothetical protein